MLTEYEKVTSLLTYLQAMRGRRLWHYEDVSLTRINLPSAMALSALTNAILESIFFERELKERWAAEALKWMLDSSSRHLACRSHQASIWVDLLPFMQISYCTSLWSQCLRFKQPVELALLQIQRLEDFCIVLTHDRLCLIQISPQGSLSTNLIVLCCLLLPEAWS